MHNLSKKIFTTSWFHGEKSNLIKYNSVLHWKKKWSHFDLKSWVHGGTKFRPRIPSNWRIFESKWLSISNQYDWNILQLLGIPGRILVPPVTQLFRSKWLHFFFQCTLARTRLFLPILQFKLNSHLSKGRLVRWSSLGNQVSNLLSQLKRQAAKLTHVTYPSVRYEKKLITVSNNKYITMHISSLECMHNKRAQRTESCAKKNSAEYKFPEAFKQFTQCCLH